MSAAVGVRGKMTWACAGPCRRVNIEVGEYSSAQRLEMERTGLCCMCGAGATYIAGLGADSSTAICRRPYSANLTNPEPLNKRIRKNGFERKYPALYAAVSGRMARQAKASGNSKYSLQSIENRRSGFNTHSFAVAEDYEAADEDEGVDDEPVEPEPEGLYDWGDDDDGCGVLDDCNEEPPENDNDVEEDSGGSVAEESNVQPALSENGDLLFLWRSV